MASSDGGTTRILAGPADEELAGGGGCVSDALPDGSDAKVVAERDANTGRTPAIGREVLTMRDGPAEAIGDARRATVLRCDLRARQTRHIRPALPRTALMPKTDRAICDDILRDLSVSGIGVLLVQQRSERTVAQQNPVAVPTPNE